MVTVRTSYLICTTPRTGSNFLCEILAGTGVAGNPDEYLWNPPHWYERWGVSDVREYIARILQEGTTPNGVFGMKIMWYELEEILPQLADIYGYEDMPVPDRLSETFPGLRYIWLRRRDTLRQAISQSRAEQTRIWRSTDAEKVPPVQPIFDFEAIDNRRGWLADGDRFWHDYFEGNRVEHLMVFYEELAQTPKEVAVEVLRYLGLCLPDGFTWPGWQHRQQADALSDDWADRYRQMSP